MIEVAHVMEHRHKSLVRHEILRSSRGQSMVQALMGMAIMSIVMLAMASMFFATYRETRASSEKIATLNLKNVLTASLADGSVCRHVLNNPAPLTFNSQALPQTITLPDPSPGVRPALYASVAAGVPGPVVAQVAATVGDSQITISSIQLVIDRGSNGAYRGEWRVSFDNTTTTRALKPVSVATALTVDDVTSPTLATITKCSSSSGPGLSQMPYYKMYWDQASTCQSSPVGFDRSIAGAWASGGELNLSYFGRPYASVLFEMTIRAPGPTTVSQFLGWVDDQVYFWLNGSLADSAVGAGTHNKSFNWNLVAGDNLIQIVINDCWWAAGHEGVALVGDFFANHPELEFVP